MDIMEMGASDDLIQKWGPALDGIENDYTKRVTAQLLENQLLNIKPFNSSSLIWQQSSMHLVCSPFVQHG